MPIVRPYPIGEVLPQRIPDDAPNVPAAGDINLFGGNQARDLQVAGQNLGQGSDALFALYERHAQEVNNTRVQDANNQYITREREILRTGPDAYYEQTGADAIDGAAATAERLKQLKDQVFGLASNEDQRRKLRPILDAHLAGSLDGIANHARTQQAVYGQRVAKAAIETSRAEAKADPANLENALYRAEGAARVLHAEQPTEAIETGAREAGASVIAGVIGDRLARNDPMGVTLFAKYGDRLGERDRRMFGKAADTLSNTIAANTWLRERSATLRTPAPTGDAALDAVNTASASTVAPPPAITSGGTLLDQDGIADTRERLGEIENRQRALTALNDSEFAANPVRLRANRVAIDADTAGGRAAVKSETDSVYAGLRRHLTTSGPNGGPAVTPPPATIMSRLTDARQDAVTAQINSNIEGRTPRTDPQTWYAIHQGLTAADPDERQRWASKNLVQLMGRLSAKDFASLEKLQTAVGSDDAGAEQNHLQIITRMANDALRSAGIDPTPRLTAAPGSDAAQSAIFHRVLQDELAAFESKGRKPTETEAYGIVNGLKDAGIEHGWLTVSNRHSFAIIPSDSSDNHAVHEPDGQVTQAESGERPVQLRGTVGTGGSNGAPATEPDPGSPEYRAADAQAQRIAAEQGRSISGTGRADAARPSVSSRDASVAAPTLAPAGAVLGEIGPAALEAARKGAALLVRVAPIATGATAAASIILIPGNSGAELHPMGEDLRVRTAPGQRTATVQRRVDDGLFGTGIGAKWVDLPVGAEWANDEQTRRRYIAIDRRGLESVIGREAADAALGGSAMVKPPSTDDPNEKSEAGPGHNSEIFGEKLTEELPDDENEKSADTPIGRRGSPIEVAPGTNRPTTIDGRSYSGHALDRMQGRGVPSTAVEDTIQNGEESAGNTPGTKIHKGKGLVVVTGENGKVLTVMTR